MVGWVDSRPHLNAVGHAIGASSVSTLGATCGGDWYARPPAVALLWSDCTSMNKGVKQRLLARSGLVGCTMMDCSPVKS
ncbi:hypothetical protein HBI55_126110 [Parastagonospora nodorum]|nr:hypothetical protein HBH47_074280 [Parastagonospora nodorum]KAH5119572.1 hypothetical protein HBH71_080000 [Parastagonospora nodorum]KAH5366071.1 hypothetical protein HBI48_065640 [Parastagonospora nodorum]KAH5378606.1 hypothetical protein HBI49_025620 [Parastagonospora nodorum]KAH5477223.1 hypothetical protein HBI28_076840 [Parastagonospora nodorum]